jgi:hypothetical protein
MAFNNIITASVGADILIKKFMCMIGPLWKYLYPGEKVKQY